MSTLIQAARPGFLLGDRPEKREADQGSAFDRRAQAWFERFGNRRPSLGKFNGVFKQIEREEQQLSSLGEAELQKQCRVLRARLLRSGLQTDLVPKAFATIRVAAHQVLGLRPHQEQLFAGWVMMHGAIAEMNTGEGKTLTAALPAIAVGLTGTPVHVVTVNDYLVERDAKSLAPLFKCFGLRVGCVTSKMSDDERRVAYAADIVYCTNKQLVFDYLRDLQALGDERVGLTSHIRSLLAAEPYEPMVRGLCYAIVDEADSVLIDDARTPLILAQPRRAERAAATEAAVALSIARTLHEGADFTVQLDSRAVWLTDAGSEVLRGLSERLSGVWRFERYRNELIRQALSALHLYRLDRDYLIREGKIELIDEGSGRIMADRKLQHGLHRMLEVKERCEVTEESETIASLSYQRFFPRYCHLAGMSGTVSEVSHELWQVYGIEVVRIPTHKTCRRRQRKTQVVVDRTEQLAWVLAEVQNRHGAGQPLLIGTRTVEMSERVSALLEANGIEHNLLNARQDAEEAKVVAQGGQPGAITVATNMAGRGTDIPLRNDAASLGGLHVLNLEVNESRRVDRQLFGRCARQGDPGSAQAILSLSDELVAKMVPKRLLALGQRCAKGRAARFTWVTRLLVRYAQRRCEREHASQRIAVFKGHEQLKRQLALSGDME
ncbi:MAG: DEAD/DEAH box helicase [Pseudomonadales bacterium]